MPQPCIACGFPADTTVRLPEPWQRYLTDDRDFPADRDHPLTVPVCVGCQQTIESLLDPREPGGGSQPDDAVRAFLDQFTHPGATP
jgi:hypothetical protein